MQTEQLTFEPYLEHDPACAVVAVTPRDREFIHSYYDICPWSPSGRYMFALRLPCGDRLPEPGEKADVCVIDLAERTLRVVWQTAAWGHQAGAHQNWGATDDALFFNDWRDGRPVGVKLDWRSGRAKILDHTVWQVAPDASYAVSPCLVRCNLTQQGYGVSVAPADQWTNDVEASPDDGFYRVDLETGGRELIVRLADVRETLPDRDAWGGDTLYAFHVKISSDGERLLLVVRGVPGDVKYRRTLLTCRTDGSGLRSLLTHEEWADGRANHPAWHSDGRHAFIVMDDEAGRRRFMLIDAETAERRPLIDDPPGDGHPTVSPDGRRLVTDRKEYFDDNLPVSIRHVDLETGAWRDLCKVDNPVPSVSPLRVDGHPAWDRRGRLVCFQGAPFGRRQLLVADPDGEPGATPV